MPTQRFINDMKRQFNMTNKGVLQAIQEEPQHGFIMETQNVDIMTASQIIEDAEYYLMTTLDNPYL
jgi:hypothetical protein